MSVNGKTAAAARLFAKLALIGSKMDEVSYRAELAVLAGVFADKDVLGGLMAPSQKKVVREKLYGVIDRHFSGRLKVHFLRFLQCLIDDDRLLLLPKISIYYDMLEDMGDSYADILIEGADPLLFDDASEKERLQDFVERYFRAQKFNHRYLDKPDLLGGVVISRGYRKIDLSLKRVFRKMIVD